MNAIIITIGQEILIGQIVDTNSAWIATQLNSIGIDVHRIISIPDAEEDILFTLSQTLNDNCIVLMTGGLGPTSDDVSKPALCKFFGCGLRIHEPSVKVIENLFISRGLPVTELNLKQAEVLECCEPLLNTLGTAPGMWINYNTSVLVSMPGVPFEMKSIMQEHVLPRIAKMYQKNTIVHKTLHTFGLPESFLADRLCEWERRLPKSIKVAYLPSPISIRIRLSSSGNNKDLIENLIQDEVEKLNQIIPQHLFGFNESDTMASVLGNLLRQTKSTLSVAESCTGGYVSHLLTQTPGSSEYFIGGVIAYSNQIKQNLLGVKELLIREHGAVSQKVVENMAVGARLAFKSDYAIATSGIAGPDGGTAQKPVGTLWVAVSSPKLTQSQLFNLGSDRERNIQRGSVSALNMLRLMILREQGKFS
jgi:nicotinamide-nucleotide amidase